MTQSRSAEKANYWSTTVHPAKSQAAIVEMLEDFGATNYQIMQGQASGRYAWLVRFEWLGQSYRLAFTPLECEHPDKVSSFGGKRRDHETQARYQMGRIATHFTKALLTAAEANPIALFGFLELPDTASHGGIPRIAGEMDVSGLRSALHMASVPELQPGDEPISAEFIELP